MGVSTIMITNSRLYRHQIFRWSKIRNYEQKTYKIQSQKQGMFVRGRNDVCSRRVAHNQLLLPMVVDWTEQVVVQTLVLESCAIDRESVITWLNKTEVRLERLLTLTCSRTLSFMWSQKIYESDMYNRLNGLNAYGPLNFPPKRCNMWIWFRFSKIQMLNNI